MHQRKVSELSFSAFRVALFFAPPEAARNLEKKKNSEWFVLRILNFHFVLAEDAARVMGLE
jgi:hypothetical protein